MIAMGLIAVMAISLIFFVKTDVPKLSETVTVSSDGVAEEALTVQSLTINPGETRECYVFLRSAMDGKFKANLTFEELNDGGLKSYVNVELFLNDQSVYDGSLTDLLLGTPVTFNTDLDATDHTLLKITYKMPVETGNEAQGTTASFDIRLKIEKSAV